MMPHAVALTENLKLRFSRTFTQQFLMCEDADFSVSGFDPYRFDGRSLLVGRSLPIAQAISEETQIIVLGIAVDEKGALATEDRLDAVLANGPDLQGLETYIAGLGGRYVVFLKHKQARRIYLDPTGSMGVMVNRETGAIGSSLFLVLDRPPSPSPDYPRELVSSRYSFGYTADRDVVALMANHYFDIASGEQVRFWPTEETPFSYSNLEELDAGMDTVIARHVQIISAIAKARPPFILPLSGGQDSRIIMAIAAHAELTPDYAFSHVTNYNTRIDAEIAAEMCAVTGWEHSIIDTMDPGQTIQMPPRRVYRYLREAALARGRLDNAYPQKLKKHELIRREMLATNALPSGGVVMRGHVTDISKAVLWRNKGISAYIEHGSEGVPNDVVAELLFHDQPALGAMPWVKGRLAAWRETLPTAAGARVLDLMGLELYRNYSLGFSFYGFWRNFYMAPGCDRQIIQHLASAPPLMRFRLQYNDRLIERTAPALRDIRYTRTSDNALRNKNSPLSESLEEYSLR